MAYPKTTQKCLGIMSILVTVLSLYTVMDNTTATWLNHGSDITNDRNANDEVLINPRTVSSRLHLRWKFIAGKDITVTPAIADGVVYFPSWNGNLYAVNAFNGALLWKQSLNELTGLNGTGIVVNVTVSRTTPAIAGGLLIVGIYGPAVVIAVNRFNGRLVWSTQIDPRPRTQITTSGTVYLGAFYVGVSSLENALPANQCCTFRGSMVKLDVQTGRVLWQTFTLPDNAGKLGGYSGAAIWGSSPAIDIRRRHVYVGTGNLYTAPPEVLRCQEERNNQTGKTPTQPADQCIGPDIHFDSIMAFDLDSGRIVWSRQLGGYDVFLFACLVPNNPDCPPGPNLDADFGEAPMLLTISSNGRSRDVAVAVQKSGYAWALDRDNGDIVWFKLAGPASLEGGGVWGAATDGKRVYTNIVNGDRKNFTLAPSNRTTNGGGWVALDANSGTILWSTADPSNDAAHGPVTAANGVIIAGSVAPNGPLYAMDANTGRILWSNETGATVKTMYKPKGIYKSARVAFCIHNIAYQGRFAFSDFSLLNLPDDLKSSFDFIDGYEKPVKGRKINWMKAGILESDKVLTVSPYYAKELVSSDDKGVELDNILRKTGITGIVNGMDVQEWNPLADKYLSVKYDASTVTDAKPLLKESLQAEVGLPVDRNIPVIGFIGRLEEQKGSDILIAAIPQFIKENVQIIVLGTGKKQMEKQLEQLEILYPDKARGIAKFNVPLAHMITAGADFILVPSRFEPCGLIQLHAMRYGTVPIVASTGGLVDTVKEGFTGFQMGAFNVECEAVDPEDVLAVATTVKRAIGTYGTPALTEIIQNCMAQDLSWKGPAKKWEEVLLNLGVAGSEVGTDGEEIAPLAKENIATP